MPSVAIVENSSRGAHPPPLAAKRQARKDIYSRLMSTIIAAEQFCAIAPLKCVWSGFPNGYPSTETILSHAVYTAARISERAT
eukprot:scaffold265533_cov28-Prasinocladus_malaysianus.AAC.1